jgi:hypothetical protein
MKILIIETEIDGHYISLYLKNIVREILSRKIESLTIITKKSVIADENYKFFKNKKINIFYIRDIKKPKKYNFLSLLIYQIRYYFNIKKCFNTISKNKKFDLVYVNTLDHFDKALSIFGSPFKKVNFYGLFNHIRFHLSYFKLERNFLFSYFYEILFRRILKIKYLKNIFVVDDYIKTYLDIQNVDNNKIIKVNEASNTHNTFISKKKEMAFRKKYLLTKNDFVILVYGAIRKDKGIKYLINSVIGNNFNKKIKIIIAGKCDSKTLNDIKQFQKLSNKSNFEIIVFNYFIDENFQNILFSASNLVWIGYTRYYGSSGVYYLAGHMKRPVIINNKGTLYNLNKKYKIGVATDVSDSKKVCDNINFIMISGLKYYKNNFKQFININKKNIFSKQITDKILLS